MRQNGRTDTHKKKSSADHASKGYKTRQIDRYVKWCINTKGYVRYRDIINQVEKYKLQ